MLYTPIVVAESADMTKEYTLAIMEARNTAVTNWYDITPSSGTSRQNLASVWER